MSIRRQRYHQSKSLWVRKKNTTYTSFFEIVMYIGAGFSIGAIIVICLCLHAIREYQTLIELLADKLFDLIIVGIFTVWLGNRLDKDKNISEKVWQTLLNIDNHITSITTEARHISNSPEAYENIQSMFENIVADIDFVKNVLRNPIAHYVHPNITSLQSLVYEFLKYINIVQDYDDPDYIKDLFEYQRKASSIIRDIMAKIV